MEESKDVFKKNSIAGLLVIIPAGLTFFLFSSIINSLDEALGPFIIRNLELVGFKSQSNFRIPGLGLALTFIGIFLVGLLVKNFVGKKVVDFWHQTVNKIPFIRTIYLTIKKIVDAITLINTPSFKQVVLLEYPREGMKSIGVISGSAKKEIFAKLQGEQICVFIPTTPNPTSGFTVILPKRKVIPLELTVEQGFKMIVSVGMFNPSKEKEVLGFQNSIDSLRESSQEL